MGGHTWVFLQLLLGLRRLGWDVLFVDHLQPTMCIDEKGHQCTFQESTNLRYMTQVMEQYGLRDSYALSYDGGDQWAGVSRAQVLQHARDSSFLLNVMGHIADEDILGSVGRRVFFDIDPGFGQMWCKLGLADIFAGHDAFVTIGQNIDRAECSIPTCDIQWITTPQPVVLDLWPPQPADLNLSFSDIATWRGAFGSIDYEGITYGLRVHEFRRFFGLPGRTEVPFEVALDIDSADAVDIDSLRSNGWVLVDPGVVARGPGTYRQYIQCSSAEFMIAKSMYVKTCSGWLSDRTLCYLASQKPVLVQDTGFGHNYPIGEGLLPFASMDDAILAIEELAGNYRRHAEAARELAETYFDSDTVLSQLIDRLSVTP